MESEAFTRLTFCTMYSGLIPNSVTKRQNIISEHH